MSNIRIFTLLFCAVLFFARSTPPGAQADVGDGNPTPNRGQVVFGLACQPEPGTVTAQAAAGMADHCQSGKPLAGAVLLVNGRAAGVSNEYGQFALQVGAQDEIKVLPPASAPSEVSIPHLSISSDPVAVAVITALILGLVAIGLIAHLLSQGLSRVGSAVETLARAEWQRGIERGLKRAPMQVMAERIADMTGEPVALDEKAGMTLVTTQPPTWKVVAADGREYCFSPSPRPRPGDRRVNIPRRHHADVSTLWRHLAAERKYQIAVPTRTQWTLLIRDPRQSQTGVWREWLRARRITRTASKVAAFAAQAGEKRYATPASPEGELR